MDSGYVKLLLPRQQSRGTPPLVQATWASQDPDFDVHHDFL